MSTPANTPKVPRPQRLILPPRPRGMTVEEIVAYELRRGTRQGECIIAALSKSEDGYAIAWVPDDRKTVGLHRLALEKRIDRRLRPGEYALHRCHNPGCINPEHLYPGDQYANMRDMRKAGRAPKRYGAYSGNHKLTGEQVKEIRRRYAAGGIRQSDLGAEYGVNHRTVSVIVRNEAWTHDLGDTPTAPPRKKHKAAITPRRDAPAECRICGDKVARKRSGLCRKHHRAFGEPKCTVPGCTRGTEALGLCTKHYTRYRNR